MEFKKMKAAVESVQDYDENDVTIVLSAGNGGFPLKSGFCYSRKDLASNGISEGSYIEAYIQAMTCQEAFLGIFDDDEEFNKVFGYRHIAPESFFPDWDKDEDGRTEYSEFARVNGRIVEIVSCNADEIVVKLAVDGYEISLLIDSDMPELKRHTLAPGKIISGEFLMTFDLNSPV